MRSLRSYSNRCAAARTGPPATSMDRVAPARDRPFVSVAGFPACDQVATHQVAGGEVKLAKLLVIHFVRRRPGIEPEGPERFTLIDVADPGTDALLQQQLSKRGCLGSAGSDDDRIQVEGIDQDIRPKVSDRCACVADQLHHRRGEADRDDIIESEDGRGAPLRLAPALTRLVEVPCAGHPHMGMKGDPTLELHHEMFAVRLDGLDPATLEARNG